MRRLTYTWPARADLDNISSFLDETAGPATAAAQLDQIRRAANRLMDFPRSGPAVGDLPFRTLRVKGTPFLIIYRLVADDVQILRVFHGAQDWRATLE